MIAARAAVPFDVDADEGRRLLLEELSAQRYAAARPTWFDRLMEGVLGWIGDLLAGAGGGAGRVALVILIVVVAAVVVGAVVVAGVPRLRAASGRGSTLFGATDRRSAAEIRAAADAAAVAGDLDLAVLERFRAIARALDDRLIVDVTPGTTAPRFGREAGTALPALARRLGDAADLFDRIRYSGAHAAADDVRELAALDADAEAARPLDATSPVPA